MSAFDKSPIIFLDTLAKKQGYLPEKGVHGLRKSDMSEREFEKFKNSLNIIHKEHPSKRKKIQRGNGVIFKQETRIGVEINNGLVEGIVIQIRAFISYVHQIESHWTIFYSAMPNISVEDFNKPFEI